MAQKARIMEAVEARILKDVKCNNMSRLKDRKGRIISDQLDYVIRMCVKRNRNSLAQRKLCLYTRAKGRKTEDMENLVLASSHKVVSSSQSHMPGDKNNKTGRCPS